MIEGRMSLYTDANPFVVQLCFARRHVVSIKTLSTNRSWIKFSSSSFNPGSPAGFPHPWQDEPPCWHVQVYVRLSEQCGLGDHLSVLNVMLARIASNMRAFVSSEDVVARTLELFQVRFCLLRALRFQYHPAC